MATVKIPVFSVVYDESGNVLDVRAEPGFNVVRKKVCFSRQQPYPTPATNLLESNSTIIIRKSSSPDCWWIVDPILGELTEVCSA
jgi:hypothetical protein